MIMDGSINSLVSELEKLNRLSNYDANGYIKSLCHQTNQLNYFYNKCAETGIEPSQMNCNPMYLPKVHSLAYFNIGRGFPKEIRDGHWCYIVSYMGDKVLIIPSTSCRENQGRSYKMEIESIDESGRIFQSVLSFSDIRCVDLQRLDPRKEYRKVITERDFILGKIIGTIY